MKWLRDLIELSSVRAELASVKAQLIEERTRHLAREDELVNAVITAAGRHGVQVGSVKPAPLPPPPSAPLINNYLDEATLASFMEDAAAEGKTPQEAIALFKRYKSGASLPYETDNLIEH